jgi:DNA-binding transcriptional LysR family regulator
VRAAVVIERALPLAKQRSITWAQLEQLPLILPPKGSSLRAAAERALGSKLTVAVETRSWPVAMRCAQLRLGAAIVNDFCTPPKNCVLRPLRQGPSVHYSLLTRAGSTLAAPADALHKAIASLRCDPKVTL